MSGMNLLMALVSILLSKLHYPKGTKMRRNPNYPRWGQGPEFIPDDEGK